jgi:hypothetical protein
MARTFIGIDPGENGCMVALAGDSVLLQKTGAPEGECWEWVARFIGLDCFALIEQQTARPTNIPRRDPVTGMVTWRQTVLASTVHLYGNYRELRMMLMCAAVRFEDCPPKRWQKGLHVPDRAKGESDTSWKNRLKQRAVELFPEVKVTLANSDALLIAEFCRRKHARMEVGESASIDGEGAGG